MSDCSHASVTTEDLGNGRMRVVCNGCGAVVYSD